MASSTDLPKGSAAYAMATTFLSKMSEGPPFRETDLNNFQIAITEYLKSPTTREHLNSDIKNLAESAVFLETSFADIYHHLTRIDIKKVLSDQDALPVELAPKWRALHDEYTSLMIESQRTATKVNSKIDGEWQPPADCEDGDSWCRPSVTTDLLHVIIPVVESESEPRTKKESLDEYIKSLEIFQSEGRKNAARFSRLRHNVGVFRTNLKETVVDQREQAGKQIKRLDRKIEKLQADLQKSSTSAAFWDVLKLSAGGLWGTAGATITALGATGSIAGASSLSALSPAIEIGILILGFISFGLSILKGVKERADRRQAQMMQLSHLEDEREELMFKTHQLKEVVDQLRSLDGKFNQMVARLSSIQGIWNMLVTDAQRLSHLLSTLKTAENAQVFELTTQGITLTYGMLQFALNEYSLAVSR